MRLPHPRDSAAQHALNAALFDACSSRCSDQAIVLIQRGAQPMAVQRVVKDALSDPDDLTPLHLAAENNLPRVVRALLEHGADVNVRSGLGCTALHSAAAFGAIEVVQELLRWNADVVALDRQRRTPLFNAFCIKHLIRERQLEVASLLIASGAPVHVRMAGERTVLHEAVSRDHLPSVGLLLRHGADPHAADVHGKTPLHTAASHGQEACMWALLKSGASVDPVDMEGQTPLGAALDRQRTQAALLLVAHGANTGVASDVVDTRFAVDFIGLPPLHAAIQGGWERLVHRLLEKGADIQSLHQGIDAMEQARRRASADRDNVLPVLLSWQAKRAIEEAMKASLRPTGMIAA